MADSQINAVEFKELTGSSHSDDGSHGLFKFMTEQGEFTVALPAAQLPRVMANVSDISAKIGRMQSKNARQALAFPCTIWDFTGEPNTETFSMSFRIPGGMEMTFQLSKKQISLMKDALTAAESGQPVIPAFGQIG
jgi:hypothetical protein